MRLLGREEIERRWIRNIQKRSDDESANLLISAYYDEIYIYSYKQTFDKETASDLTQDVFITMLRSIKIFDEKKASFRTWLYKIATNKIIDYKRRIRSNIVSLEDIEIPVEIEYHILAENKKLAEKIETYLSALPPERQEVFRMKVYGEYTFAQIADILQKPENTVKTLYYRLISQLRKEFEHEYSDAG